MKASVVYKKYQKTNALKETHLMESDRNTTSPTESVVCGKWGWEHSGADYLNRRMKYPR